METDWSWAANQLQARCRRPLNHFMKIRIALCVVLGASFISFGAPDNPAQAAARAALEQKLKQPDAWEPQPLTEVANLPSIAMAKPSVKPVASVAGIVSAKMTAPPNVPAPTARVAAPAPAAAVVTASAAVAPATVAPAVTVPAMTAPAGTVPVTSLLILSFLIASLLTVMVLLLKLWQVKLKLRQVDSRF